jgi:type III restriction enzyme
MKDKEKKPIIHLNQKLPEVPGRDPYSPPCQYLQKDGQGGYTIENIRRPSKTLLVNLIRKEVDVWRKNHYQHPTGISSTSLRLLEWWFDETHYSEQKEVFSFYFAQREAIETIIYLYEVKGYRDCSDLIANFMDPQLYPEDLYNNKKKIIETAQNKRVLIRLVPETQQIAQQELPQPDHYRYAIKMATGSGKTLVMAMAIIWSYFHKKFEPDSFLSKTFLVLAPNVIVFERLREDFENGKIFPQWQLFPPEWKDHWQMTVILRGESRRTNTDGALYLTNIHQLYERENGENSDDPVNVLLGTKPKVTIGSWESSILERVKEHSDLLVINDEAHHVHDEDLRWYQIILSLQDNLKKKNNKNLSLQLDFTATPKDQNGTFFPWIICDYPLAQAVEDRIVKLPLIVHQTDKINPEKYDRASVVYAEWINIAISRWQEHYEAYSNVGKKPVLFIMAENTKDANDIYDSLIQKDGFQKKDQVLLIHTNRVGEISKSDLERAREAARSIDLPGNKIRAIVSVLMLREGWDVRNVSIILGLRPFTSKSNILPEQAVGRGLRPMKEVGPDYVQILEIIGTPHFEEFVKQLEVEGVGVGYTTNPPPPGLQVFPVKIKTEYDIKIPILSPTHHREYTNIGVDILEGLKKNPLEIIISSTEKDKVKIELIDGITEYTVGEKFINYNLAIPILNDILINFTTRICKEARIEGQFSTIYPILKKYLSEYFFGQEVNLDNEVIRRALCDIKNSDHIIRVLSKRIGEKSVLKTHTQFSQDFISLLETDAFFWRRDYTECNKTVFNITPCYNGFEKHFALFLDQATDISAFAKLAEFYTHFSIEYINHRGAIAYYYPDFVAIQKTTNGKATHWVIETKGREFEDVALKDRRAHDWCSDATRLTGQEWKYLKINQVNYDKLTQKMTSMPGKNFDEFLMKLVIITDPGDFLDELFD